ncbi:MAG: glycosyltransferase family 2 protein [Chloroflexota bacterium]|nr:glycosyltransferase family 2 protein [Chloroflexota bacterium]
MSEIPSISFGLIVLNGEPFIRYILRALYPYAREIIVVEGATPGALNIATAGGHSRDSTLETLYDFKAREDPDDKLQIVTRDGFWSEKDEMSQAYAARASGDYLWQVDVDEFYQPADMEAVLGMLAADPSITAVSFDTITFWGAPSYYVDSWYLRRGAAEYHRLFKWGAGYRYVTHRPPTVLDKEGRDLRAGHWLRGAELRKRGIRMYHYSLLLPKQVLEKCEYYSRAEWAQRQGALDWAHKTYLALERPYHLHNVDEYPGCLYRYRGEHPPQLLRMWQDIGAPDSACEIRPRDDIEALLDSWTYRGGRWLVMRADRPARILRMLRRRLRQALAQFTPRLLKDIIRRR